MLLTLYLVQVSMVSLFLYGFAMSTVMLVCSVLVDPHTVSFDVFFTCRYAGH